MRSYKDRAGNEWKIDITIGACQEVYEATNQAVNLLQLQEGKPPLIQQLHSDVFLLVRVLYLLLKEQADARGMDFKAFTRTLSGDVSWSAYTAFMADLADFFRECHRPEAMRVVEEHQRLVETASNVMEKKILQASEEAILQAKKLESMSLSEIAGLGTTFGNSPESAA